MSMEQSLTKEDKIIELLEMLNQNNMQDKANHLFELCTYMEGLEHKVDEMTNELIHIRKEIVKMRQDILPNHVKEQMHIVANHVSEQCENMKAQIVAVKERIVAKTGDIVVDVKQKGKAALQRISEFIGLKEKLGIMQSRVQSSLEDVEHTIGKMEAFGNGMREANQQIANTFRIAMGKDIVDYKDKEKRFSKTAVVIKPWQAGKKLLESIKQYLDGAIEKVETFSELGKTKTVEQERDRKQEQVSRKKNSEPMVAEPEYQYGSDAFEERMQQKKESTKVLEEQVTGIPSVSAGKSR